jgi:hypothetical protein
MKQPRKLTPPKKDERQSIYVETKSTCTHDYHDGKRFGDWEKTYSNKVEKISRNKDLLNKWNFEEYKVPDETYAASTLYLVVVTYSSGDSFGRSEGNTSVAYITENSGEALEIRDMINVGKKPSKDDQKYQHGGYAPWDGHFERVSDVDIVFLPVMG